MINIFMVGIGGFLGAIVRFLLIETSIWLLPLFPWGTLLVNVIGSFLAGFVLYCIAPGKFLDPSMRHFLNTGFLGAFTTMSAFAHDTISLFEHKGCVIGLLNISANVLLSLAAVLLGRWCAMWLLGR